MKRISSYARIITGIVVILFCALSAGAASGKNEHTTGPFYRHPEKTITNNHVIAKTVTGKVTDNNGGALVGVSVLEKGTSYGAVTNQDGKYSITVTGNNSVLQFQHVGYGTKTEAVGARTVVNVALQPQAKEMNEVVVTALGIRKEAKKLGFAVTTVQVDELTRNQIGRASCRERV